MYLFFVRHGDPIYTPDSLTPLGERQAEALAKRLALHGIDRIFSSTSCRAIQTAKPTSELTKKPIETLLWCHEALAWKEFAIRTADGTEKLCFLDDQTRARFLSTEIFKLGENWYEHPAFAKTEMANGMRRIRRETDAFLASLGFEHDRQKHLYIPKKPTCERIALFAHHCFGLAFLSALLDIPYPMLCTHFDLAHTGMTVIHFSATAAKPPCVLQLSSDSHLYHDAMPTEYRPGLPI